jgi:hypothetical protein
VRGLFRAISADRHAAPPPRLTACSIEEEQRTCRPPARFHLREVRVEVERAKLVPELATENEKIARQEKISSSRGNHRP